MSDTKFTPGPWKAFFGTENNSVLLGIGEESTGEGVADCGQIYCKGKFGIWRGKDPEARANAHLIAAAPEMYEQLQSARDKVARLVAELGGDEYAVAMACDPYDATLCKARGEQ
jgi:hypothetical protein